MVNFLKPSRTMLRWWPLVTTGLASDIKSRYSFTPDELEHCKNWQQRSFIVILTLGHFLLYNIFNFSFWTWNLFSSVYRKKSYQRISHRQTFSVCDEHHWRFIALLADILHWRVKFEIFNALPNKQQKPWNKICDDFLSFTLFHEVFSPHYFVLWSYYVVKLLMRNSMLLFLCS